MRMAAARALPDLTRTEDFLEWVWGQDYKFEMIEDRLVMMAGGSRNHAAIAVNMTIALGNRLTGKPCRPFNSDFLLEANGRNRYYPDVTVACGETRDFTDQPVLVVEVLSPSTQREDLGPKLRNYLRIAGLQYLLYVWQDQPKVRLYLPAGDGGARPREIIGLEQTIELPALGISLPMVEIYRDVIFA
jgi:Uma2 family endonuclease